MTDQEFLDNIVWLGSPNFWKGHNGQKAIAIVCHIAQGTLAGTDATFQDQAPNGDPNKAVSAHFAVGKDGTIHQYVSTDNSAWANGIVEPGNTMPAFFPHVDPNWFTISIEHEGFTGQGFSDLQYQSSRSLIGYLTRKFSIPVDGDHIIGHSRISPHSRPDCPGHTFPWLKLFADITEGSMFLGAPHGGATVFSHAGNNSIGQFSEVQIMTFANGVLWATPDDGWQVHAGLPHEMTDAQVRIYAKDIWGRANAPFVDNQAFPEAWLRSFVQLRP
jgi:N-acetylmuramoyl-L-alanine amidase